MSDRHGSGVTVTLGYAFTVSRAASEVAATFAAGAVVDAGAVAVGAAELAPHTPGPPPHVHTREDEALYVLSGVLTCLIGDVRFEAGPSTMVWLPRGVVHSVANFGADPVRTIGCILPAGLESMFAEQADYVAGLTGPPDPHVLSAIGQRFGVRTVGPSLAAGR